MTRYYCDLKGVRHSFAGLAQVMAAASPERSGDRLAGIAAISMEQRVAARYVLADLPLAAFLDALVVPYEADEVSRLIVDGHDAAAFAPIAHLTVGGFREWLLANETDDAETTATLLHLLDDIRLAYDIPTQSCVLAHVTTTLDLVARGAPVDLCFQSIAGTEAANRGFGIDLALLAEAHAATRACRTVRTRGTSFMLLTGSQEDGPNDQGRPRYPAQAQGAAPR